jgi:transcriptional regulator with XRE-family HTH domain
MRLRCHLREARGKRSIREIAAESGIDRGSLSQIERGQRLPLDDQVRAIERVYGIARTEFYDANGTLAIVPDEDPA